MPADASPPTFKDHFSEDSADYARFRPRYPEALFAWLAGQCDAHNHAWDCATGSGQAAAALSPYFDAVTATDASAGQIEAALPGEGVRYAVAPAEASGLANESVNLVTVGQALHWFDRPKFFAEAARVLTPGGLLAAWCYERCEVSDAVDEVVESLYSDRVGPFWPPERVLIEEGYRSITFPGVAIETPAIEMQLEWQADDMLGYLGTWSACKRYEAAHGSNPVDAIADLLRDAWGDGARCVRWPLRIRVCRL